MSDAPFDSKSLPTSALGNEPTAEGRPTLQMRSGRGTVGFDDTGGSGPMVIAVPGMGDLRREYRYLTPYLTAAGYRVVTMDVRGHGATSPQWSDYSARAIGQDVLDLMTHLGQTRASIIGNSFSAGAALWAAHDAPEKASQAVLIGPVLRDPPKGIPGTCEPRSHLVSADRGAFVSGSHTGPVFFRPASQRTLPRIARLWERTCENPAAWLP